MTIYNSDGTEFLEVIPDDNSNRYLEIMGDDVVNLSFSLAYFVEIPIGSYILFQNVKYTLNTTAKFVKRSTREWEYTCVYDAPSANLAKYKFRNIVDKRLKFTLTAQPFEFIDAIIFNLKEREGEDSGWVRGECIESTEKTVTFSFNNLREALQTVAETFETEWEISDKTINLKKVEKNKESGYPTLAYGKGNGFKSGITRQLTDEKPIDKLFVEGGNRNINSMTYVIGGEHCTELRLPRNLKVMFDGEKLGFLDKDVRVNGSVIYRFENGENVRYAIGEGNAIYYVEKGFKPYKIKWYKTDEFGFSLEPLQPSNTGIEDALSLTDIYPMKELEVYFSRIVKQKTTNSDGTEVGEVWDVYSIDNPIDYSQHLTAETATVIFQSGMLEGKEFDVDFDKNNKNHFLLVSAEIDGISMPDKATNYYPRPYENEAKHDTKGDKFAVFHVSLPDEYIREAELKMLREAVKYLYEHSDQKVEFTGELDGIYAKKNWESLQPKLVLGGYVAFTDEQVLGSGKYMVRITNIKQPINNPHSPTITLSNQAISGNGVASSLRKIDQNEVYMKEQLQSSVNYTKRTFATAEETADLIAKAVQAQFTESIAPATIKSMQMLLGNSELQFYFGRTVQQGQIRKGQNGATLKDDSGNIIYYCKLDKINFEPQFSDNGKELILKNQGNPIYLCHTGLVNKDVLTSENRRQDPVWRLDTSQSMRFTVINPDSGMEEESDGAFYLYAKCNKTNYEKLAKQGKYIDGNVWVLSATTIEHTASYFYFLVGTVNSRVNGARSYANLFGFTEILPGMVRTDKIVSDDGSAYIDLVENKVGGTFNFTDGLISDVVYIGNRGNNTQIPAAIVGNDRIRIGFYYDQGYWRVFDKIPRYVMGGTYYQSAKYIYSNSYTDYSFLGGQSGQGEVIAKPNLVIYSDGSFMVFENNKTNGIDSPLISYYRAQTSNGTLKSSTLKLFDIEMNGLETNIDNLLFVSQNYSDFGIKLLGNSYAQRLTVGNLFTRGNKNLIDTLKSVVIYCGEVSHAGSFYKKGGSGSWSGVTWKHIQQGVYDLEVPTNIYDCLCFCNITDLDTNYNLYVSANVWSYKIRFQVADDATLNDLTTGGGTIQFAVIDFSKLFSL